LNYQELGKIKNLVNSWNYSIWFAKETQKVAPCIYAFADHQLPFATRQIALPHFFISAIIAVH